MDYQVLLSCSIYGKEKATCNQDPDYIKHSDLDSNGIVNENDLTLWIIEKRNNSPTARPTATPTPKPTARPTATPTKKPTSTPGRGIVTRKIEVINQDGEIVATGGVVALWALKAGATEKADSDNQSPRV